MTVAREQAELERRLYLLQRRLQIAARRKRGTA